MTNTEALYLYVGNEDGYAHGWVYAYVNEAWTAVVKYGGGGGGGSDVTEDLILVGTTPAASTHLLVNDEYVEIVVPEMSDIPEAVTEQTVSGWGFAKRSEIPAAVTDAHIIDVITATFPNAEGVGF